MSSFKFNFSQIETEENENNSIQDNIDSKAEESSELSKNNLKSWEVLPNENIVENIDDLVVKGNVFLCGDFQIEHVLPQDAVRYLEEDGRLHNLDNSIILADSLHSDLIDGKYEGGLKIWECTNDLAEYVCDKNLLSENAVVLDLGCGTGILGIVALLSGAQVHFQDYNEEVLIGATIPNVILNLAEEERKEIKNRCKFFAGDWESLEPLLTKDTEKYEYDYILTSETIYNPKNYEKLCKLMKEHLKKTGAAFVAAKSYYFGVGGSVKDFEQFVIKDGAMNCEICWKSEIGVTREILKLTLK